MKTIEMSEAMRLVKEGNMLSKDERIQLQTQRWRLSIRFVILQHHMKDVVS